MTESGPPWRGEDWPELRVGPPWVMEEMVAAEPGLGAIADAPALPRVAAAVREALAADAPVVVTGCGTSEHGAQAVAAQVAAALGPGGERRVEAREAFAAALEPRRGGLCVGISHEGTTRATVAALAAARSAGARTALVTAVGDRPAARHADDVLVTPLLDRSWCHTIGYLSPVLVGGALAGHLAGAPPDARSVERLIVEASRIGEAAGTLGRALATVERLIVVGDALDAITARELVLKVEEATHVPAAMREVETFLHGHLPAADERTGLVLLLVDPAHGPARARRAAALLAAAARAGIRAAAVVAADAAPRLGDAPTPAGRATVTLPTATPLDVLVAGALALQHLTLGLVAARGTNPDLIRREQEPYRDASRLAGEGPWDVLPG